MDVSQTLNVSLMNLRRSWPHGWPGMQAVVAGCFQRLDLDLVPTDPAMLTCTRCIHDLSDWLERDGEERRRDGVEPAYHNRLHTADTMVSLTLLLQAQRQLSGRDPVASARHERLSLLAMLAHDLLHDGGVNQFEAQLESRSVQALTPLMQHHGLPGSDQAVVRHLILKTDAQAVPATHKQIAGRPFDLDDLECLTVLVQEADIMASTLPSTGPSLTHHLAEEWTRSNPSQARQLLTPAGRLRFLEHAALFSSPASQLLGAQTARQAQMDALRHCLDC